MYICIIKQGDSDSALSVDLIQLLKVIMVWGFTLRHWHTLFVE